MRENMSHTMISNALCSMVTAKSCGEITRFTNIDNEVLVGRDLLGKSVIARFILE
jgi:hypothetical protein